MAGWAAVGQIAGEVGTSLINAHGQHKANRTNIRLQREQQQWEQMMSNTAVQRRKADIIAAGGNPAAAFVNGSEASTPTISPARVEGVKFNAPNIQSAMMLRAQLDNIKADTIQKSAATRAQTVATDIVEGSKDSKIASDLEMQKLTPNKARAEIENLLGRTNLTAKQAEKLDKTMDSLVSVVQQQARAGKLDLDALENIASVGGIEAGKMKDTLKVLADLFRMLVK